MKNSKVDWFDKEVKLQLENATGAMLRSGAALIEQQTKLNIQANGQVDTGMMINSVYFASDGESTYQDAANGAMGAKPDGVIAPEADVPNGGALVGVGAEYAIFQEERQPFLYPAVVDVASKMQGEIVNSGRKVIS